MQSVKTANIKQCEIKVHTVVHKLLAKVVASSIDIHAEVCM